MTLVVISPHLDDAVFSCGTLIAAQAVARQRPLIVTVCAGVPDGDFVTQLDQAAGFATSREAVLRRREEDLEAAAILGADVRHLDVLDGQYDRDDPLDRRNAIRAALDTVETLGPFEVLAPVGIRHADHGLVAAACADFADWLYEELPYRVLWPDMRPDGLPEEPALHLPTSNLKERAIACYRSQLGDGPAGIELRQFERYHRAPR